MMTESENEMDGENEISCEQNGVEDLKSLITKILPPSPTPPAPSQPPLSVPPCTLEEYEALLSLKNKLESDLIRMKKEVEMALKAKEVTVMRYANSEIEVIRHKNQLENSDKQIKNLMKETENLNKKNKMLSSERERLIHMVDAKVCDLQTANKEIGRLKDELNSKDFKIKWTQAKLATESETHKETQQKLTKCAQELQIALAESNKMRIECQDMLDSCENDSTLSPDNFNDDQNLKSETDNSVLEKDYIANPFKKEVELLKQRHRALIDENNSLSRRIQISQEDRLDMEQRLVRLQESNGDHLHQIASLQSDLATAESLKVQLHKDQERMATLQTECDRLRQCNTELLSDMALCRGKEAELLAYTQKVTEKNVFLQSEFSSTEGKSLILEEENDTLRSRIEELASEMKKLDKSIVQERKGFHQEKKSLMSRLENQKTEISSLQERLDEASGEILVLKKKHESTFRELTKELQIATRLGKECATSTDGISQSSRTSSTNSLNNIDSIHQKQQNHENTLKEESEIPVVPDQQVLIERIVKLQKLLAKKQEKIEFVQEHNKQLVDAFQRKCKIIQCYVMNQDPGALSTGISDQNKAEVIKHGGIMASLYGSKASDDGLTLELSLEINRKIQAVLEDTLLKNITLKENINTLGKEISDLIESNRKLTEKLDRLSN